MDKSPQASSTILNMDKSPQAKSPQASSTISKDKSHAGSSLLAPTNPQVQGKCHPQIKENKLVLPFPKCMSCQSGAPVQAKKASTRCLLKTKKNNNSKGWSPEEIKQFSKHFDAVKKDHKTNQFCQDLVGRKESQNQKCHHSTKEKISSTTSMDQVVVYRRRRQC
jgi:hypothetical protein